MAKHALRVLYAPLFFGGFLVAGGVASDAGAAPWPLLPLLVAAIAVSFAAERWIPYEPAFNRDHGDTGRDLAHAAVNETANAASVLALPAVAAALPVSGAWPAHWPLPLQLALAVGVADLGITLAHYASHRAQVLWRFHAVHHSVSRMYGFNGLMKHPLHQAFELLCGTAPLVLLGLPQPLAWLLAFAVALQLLLQHANVDLRPGPLLRVWAVAPLHRFHHLNRAALGDVNFGLFTTLGDRLLGTLHYEPGRRFGPGELGIEGRPDYPTRYRDQLLEPFRAPSGSARAIT